LVKVLEENAEIARQEAEIRIDIIKKAIMIKH
jgi:hypothetical protein